ncbi:discoidin domain-containing protein [Paenibacillus mendelii]|uniref:Discoidin domain-containing protein n=1 Tax=Paenibacillus mendelii TaxID=206163 RepID=A0ABV6JAP5_9BACL|nr:discoidin domain-containing protein [Paenibacillus mendelii]MCQ6563135.1 discoidin domain-containing protein [Paenibacillus mendelii]
MYYGSVGGNATFLLNLPPDKRGLIHENDRARLSELGEAIRNTFRTNLAEGSSAQASGTMSGHQVDSIFDGNPDTYWCPEEGTEQVTIEVDLKAETEFNLVVLQEHRYSQRIEKLELEVQQDGEWKPLWIGTVVGYKRICWFDKVTSRYIRFKITESRWCPRISVFEVFCG